MKAKQTLMLDRSGNYLRLRDLFFILLFCLLLRGPGNWAVNLAFSGGDVEFYARILVQSTMYGLIVLLCVWHIGLRRNDFTQMIGEPTFRGIVLGAAFGIVLFSFGRGEDAFETWLLAQVNEDLAYSIWAFPLGTIPAWDTLEVSFIAYLAVGIVLAPAVEEFFFRGVVLPCLISRMGLHRAAFWTSVFFIGMHPKHLHIISTLVFSLSLSYLYIASRSLKLCTVVHGMFNLAAYVSENFLIRGWQIRGRSELRYADSWSLEFGLLIASSLVIAYAAYRFRLLKLPLTYAKPNAYSRQAGEGS